MTDEKVRSLVEDVQPEILRYLLPGESVGEDCLARRRTFEEIVEWWLMSAQRLQDAIRAARNDVRAALEHLKHEGLIVERCEGDEVTVTEAGVAGRTWFEINPTRVREVLEVIHRLARSGGKPASEKQQNEEDQ